MVEDGQVGRGGVLLKRFRFFYEIACFVVVRELLSDLKSETWGS